MFNLRIAVAVSGEGTLLEAMLRDSLTVSLVLADRPCRGINEVSQFFQVPTELIHRKNFTDAGFDRVAFTKRIEEVLREYRIDILAMAGFMTVLSPEIFNGYYKGKILNSHPSLLPAFPGPSAVADALAYGVKVTGCTVHVATAVPDTGPILSQKAVYVEKTDTEATLHRRIKEVEHRLYPATIRGFIRSLPQ